MGGARSGCASTSVVRVGAMSDTKRDRKWWTDRAWNAAAVVGFFYLCGWLVADLLGDGDTLSGGESVFWFVALLVMAFAWGVRVCLWQMRRGSAVEVPQIDVDAMMTAAEQVKTLNAAVVGIGTEMRTAMESAGFSPTAAEQIALMAMARASPGGSS